MQDTCTLTVGGNRYGYMPLPLPSAAEPPPIEGVRGIGFGQYISPVPPARSDSACDRDKGLELSSNSSSSPNPVQLSSPPPATPPKHRSLWPLPKALASVQIGSISCSGVGVVYAALCPTPVSEKLFVAVDLAAAAAAAAALPFFLLFLMGEGPPSSSSLGYMSE